MWSTSGRPETVAKMIPLAKIAELRDSRWRHGLKSREDYKKAKGIFIATQNPRQKPRQTNTIHKPPKTTTKTTETMVDTSMKIFYGD